MSEDNVEQASSYITGLDHLDLDVKHFKQINAACQQELNKQKKKLERNKFIEINHIKKHSTSNAIQFVKNASLDVEKALTKEI